MIHFRLQEKSGRIKEQMIEVIDSAGGEETLLAAIYPSKAGIKIVSGYMAPDKIRFKTRFPKALDVTLP